LQRDGALVTVLEAR
jgi:monoamine oxidase